MGSCRRRRERTLTESARAAAASLRQLHFLAGNLIVVEHQLPSGSIGTTCRLPKLDPTWKPWVIRPNGFPRSLAVRSASPSCLMHFAMHFGGSPKLTWLV